MHLLAKPTFAALLFAGAATAQTVWTVGPAGDFTDIQPAVDAAADGDLILVDGNSGAAGYSAFVVDAKSLTILGEERPNVLPGPTRVRNVALDQRVVIRAMDFPGSFLTTMSVQANDGPVWIEDCYFNYGSHSDGDDVPNVISVASSAAFVMCRCTSIRVDAQDSNVYLYESTFSGE